MNYEEITDGQRVRIVTRDPRFRNNGTVVAKEIQTVAGKDKYVVYVDDDRNRRRLCAPSVLEPIN